MVPRRGRARGRSLSRRLIPVALGGLVLMGMLATRLAAHPANVAYARVSIAEAAVEIALSLNLFELDLVLSLDRDLDGRVDGAELEARHADIVDYLRDTVGVSASGRALTAAVLALEPGRSRDGRAVLEATLWFGAAAPLGDVVVRCEPLTELGGDHTTLARIDVDGASREFVFRSGVPYRDGPGLMATALEFLKLGIVHIFIGYDHIAFLLALLLTGASLTAVVKIVSAFTAAHSLTLSLAALDVLTLAPAVVEAGIALSIVYVAAENLFTARREGRFLVSFVFGLVHGFGFAEVLKELGLPSSALVTSLVTFNVGVEIAQVAIVAAALPILYGLTRTRLHAPLTRVASAIILTLGLVWLYQRTLA
jgi:hydrogenase/urease accessory protein HupE